MKSFFSKYCSPLEELFSPSLFKAFGDPKRIGIFCDLLRESVPRTVSEVASCCPIDVSVVSRHLRVLQDAGVVSRKKKGKQVFYQVEAQALVQMLRELADSIEKCCLSEEGTDVSESPSKDS